MLISICRQDVTLDTFIVKLVSRLRGKEIFGLIVKGQGVAQCYERPKWRASGDVDLLLDEENYEKAKSCLIPIAYDVKEEACEAMHQELSIMGVVVELHGKMPFGMSKKADRIIGNVIYESLHTGAVNAWRIDNTDVFIPNPDNHVLLVFTHYLRHFFIEGVGLRQICDWCRIIWSYSKIINVTLLEKRLHSMGLTSEWKTFSALAVNTLGIPQETMPLFDITYRKRGERVLNNVLKRGNFGHNNDLSYRVKYKGFAYNIVSLWRRMCDFAGFTLIFPLDAPRFFFSYLFNKVK